MRLVVGSGGEIQRRRRPGLVAVPESDAPEAVDHDRAAARVSQLTGRCEVSGGVLLEGMDVTVAEVPDEQVARELAESGRCPRQPPRRVEVACACDATEQMTALVIRVDVAEARSINLVHAVWALLGIRDEDRPAEVLDPERCESGGQARIDERPWRHDLVERAVEDVDATVVKVGRVQARARDPEPLEHRALVHSVHHNERVRRRRRWRNGGIPAVDRAVLTCEHEERRTGVPGSVLHDALAAAVEGSAGGPALDADYEWRRDAVAAVG